MSNDLGLVVIEYNQASRQPEIAPAAPYLFDDVEDAQEKAVTLTLETQQIGRRERYRVATVSIEDDE